MTDLAISNVHDAISDAVAGKNKAKKSPMENLTVRLDPSKKEQLNRICATHGISASDYMRSCADRLLLDFMGPTAFARFEASLNPQTQQAK